MPYTKAEEQELLKLEEICTVPKCYYRVVPGCIYCPRCIYSPPELASDELIALKKKWAEKQ